MATRNANAANTRKRAPVEITKSKEAIVAEIATSVWAQLFTPNEQDAEKNAAAHKAASDSLQKLMEQLRSRRDDSKPVIRERLDTDRVLAASVGKSVSDLQAAYVQIPIGSTAAGAVMLERVSLPKLRQFSEAEGHPYHEAAVNFLAEHKLKFIEREGAAKGKKITVLDKATARASK